MKELNSGWQDAIRNRNLITEGLAIDGGLPTKYDMLNGKPIRNWDFPTRMFNMFSLLQSIQIKVLVENYCLKVNMT